MTNLIDTIAAIATAAGEGGISIVRISGPESFSIADKVFHGSKLKPSDMEHSTFQHGFIGSAESDLDEVILLAYRAPNSYTREDVIEIQGHGGPTCARRILRSVLENGARIAEAGEFTRRAFLNGRIDLLQAEAVIDLIRARTDRAAAAAVEQLEGKLSSLFGDIYDDMMYIASDLEATLDFSDQELPDTVMSDIKERMNALFEKIKSVLSSWEEGHLLREGAVVVIFGKPNVGKSTLMNRLLEIDRAIVSSTPGTTRDIIEEQIVMNGIPMRLIDTAGLRDSDCHIEREGIERAHTAIDKADINLFVIDGSEEIDDEITTKLNELDPQNTILILNKQDLGIKKFKELEGFTTVHCSLLNNEGLSDVRKAITSITDKGISGPAHAVISERHRQIIDDVLKDTTEAQELLSSEREDVIVPAADLLRISLENLGTVTGKTYSDELLDNIFSRFCIGK